jgi:hypothetical protein
MEKYPVKRLLLFFRELNPTLMRAFLEASKGLLTVTCMP